MVTAEYAIAYKEVLEILKHISIDDRNKIPMSKIKLFEENADSNYVFNYNPKKRLEEQNISRRGKAIISILYRDYWATDERRKEIDRKQMAERVRIDEEKKTKYDPDTIFRKKSPNNDYVENNNDNTEIIEIEKNENILYKIINKIKNFFKRGKNV